MKPISESGRPEAIAHALRELGTHVKRARKEAFKESRVSFAERIGCSSATLGRVERGEPGVAVVHLMSALHAMSVLLDVVDAAAPDLLIYLLIPVTWPEDLPGVKSVPTGS